MLVARQEFFEFDQQSNTLICKGQWDLEHLTSLFNSITRKSIPAKKSIEITGEKVEKLDSAGVWMLMSGITSIIHKDTTIKIDTFTEQQQKSAKNKELNWIQKLGKGGLSMSKEFYDYVNFIGELYFDSLAMLKQISK